MSFETLHDSRADLSAEIGLPEQQQDRLAQILDDYLMACESGEVPDTDAIIAANPDLADHLRRYLQSLNDLHMAAGGFGGATLPDDDCPDSDDSERRLGEFEIVREIGRGGMATVFEARQQGLDRRVALKVLPFAAVIDTKQITRFRNEAQVLGQIQHPNIVPVYGVGEHRGIHYFAMRLIDGLPLDQVVDELIKRDDRTCHNNDTQCVASPAVDTRPKNGLPQTTAESPDRAVDVSTNAVLCHFPPEETARFDTIARIGCESARALHAAHEYGIIHRDVKPSNLLVESDGRVWVTDFGLARSQSDQQLTRTGDVVGTLRYMSPEQACGDLVDQRTDVYSLGMTLYELVTHRPAFDGEGAALLQQIEFEEPVAPRRFVPELPVDLESIILKATAGNREDRYETAEVLADDLDRFLQRAPTVARQPSINDRLRRWVRRHERATTLLASMGAVALIMSIAFSILIYQEKLTTEDALEEAQVNFRQARNVVDRLGAGLAERLAGIPGTEAVRREILLDTRDYYQQFIEQSGDRTGVRSDLATTLNRIAMITEHLGSAEEALSAHREARDMFDQLVTDEPGVTEHQGARALCENNIGLLLVKLNRPAEAGPYYKSAIETQRHLLERGEPVQQDLAASLNNQGLLQSESGQHAAAALAFGQARHILEHIIEQSPDDETARRYLATTYDNLAALPSDSLPERPEVYSTKSLNLLIGLSDQHPEQSGLRAELAQTLNNRGALLARSSDLAGAADAYGKAVDIQRELVAASPLSLTHRRCLAVTLNNLGMTLARSGDASRAEAMFQEATTTQAALVTTSNASLADSNRLGGIYNNLAMIMEGLDRDADAIAAYQQAAALLEDVYNRSSDRDIIRGPLSQTWFNFARVLRRQGRTQEAFDTILKRRALWQNDIDGLVTVAEELAELLPISSEHSQIVASLNETLAMGRQHGLTRERIHQSETLRQLMRESR